MMISFKKDHLTNSEMGKILALSDDIFDVATMTKLLTKLEVSLKYYEPDAMVKSYYLYQHAHSLGWGRDKLTFRNPKEMDSRPKGIPNHQRGKSPLQGEKAGIQDQAAQVEPPQGLISRPMQKKIMPGERHAFNHTRYAQKLSIQIK